MFRHTGKGRTFIHNLKLASLLSFVAGIVNVVGLFSVQRLTTNLTGHFAYLADEAVKNNLYQVGVYFVFVLCFLLGAFISNTVVEVMIKINEQYSNIIPIVIEILLLTTVASLSTNLIHTQPNTIACILLFTMGLQNAMVTKISDSVVRTTHLTGLFTDLGIELSQLFFYVMPGQSKKLKTSIRLRFAIIGCFFLGGVIGGFGYVFYNVRILYLAVAFLFAGIIYARIKYKVLILKKKHFNTF